MSSWFCTRCEITSDNLGTIPDFPHACSNGHSYIITEAFKTSCLTFDGTYYPGQFCLECMSNIVRTSDSEDIKESVASMMKKIICEYKGDFIFYDLRCSKCRKRGHEIYFSRLNSLSEKFDARDIRFTTFTSSE